MLDLLDLISDASFGAAPSAWRPPAAPSSGGAIEAGLRIDKRHALATRELDHLDDLVAARLIGTYVGRRVGAADSDLYTDASGKHGDRYRQALLAPARSNKAPLYTLYAPSVCGAGGSARCMAMSAGDLATFAESEARVPRVAVSSESSVSSPPARPAASPPARRLVARLAIHHSPPFQPSVPSV